MIVNLTGPLAQCSQNVKNKIEPEEIYKLNILQQMCW